jgi:small subunit ribosomal protein S16
MVRIRLRRQGFKRQPSYRIVVTDKRNARDGAYLEVIGHYNPRTRPATEIVQEDRALYWLSVGAQPSDSVERIFKHTGTQARYERMRKGEAVETLVAEAEANRPELPSQKTRYPAPGAGESKIKAREAAKAEAAE